MLGNLSGNFLNIIKGSRKTYWNTMVSSSGTTYPVATVTFGVFIENSMNIVHLQFRGEQAIDRLKNHFSTGINGISVEGHFEIWKLPSVSEASDNSYSNMLESVDNGEAIEFSGAVTTVIVVDSFMSCPSLTVADLNDIYIRKGMTPDQSSTGNGIKFTGIVYVNSSITNDGPKYNFGKSQNRDKTKVRYSISGITRHGNSYGKLRVEIHGENRVTLFSSVCSRNNSLFVHGNIIVYREDNNAVSFGLWVNQFMGFNSGSVESVAGSIGNLGDVEITENDLDLDPEWDQIYSGSSSNSTGLDTDMFSSEDDIPF